MKVSGKLKKTDGRNLRKNFMPGMQGNTAISLDHSSASNIRHPWPCTNENRAQQKSCAKDIFVIPIGYLGSRNRMSFQKIV